MGNELENGLLALIVAISISMALIPLLIRFAPALGMMDKPDPRKVHAIPIPRVGGIGIVLGALLPDGDLVAVERSDRFISAWFCCSP